MSKFVFLERSRANQYALVLLNGRESGKRQSDRMVEDCFAGIALLLTGRHVQAMIDELKGRDLMCWCPIGSCCHADWLLDIANCP